MKGKLLKICLTATIALVALSVEGFSSNNEAVGGAPEELAFQHLSI